LTEEQATAVAAKLEFDGFATSSNEVKALLGGFVKTSKLLCSGITNRTEAEDGCPICEAAHEEEDHEGHIEAPAIN
jgi:hypothetical protein